MGGVRETIRRYRVEQIFRLKISLAVVLFFCAYEAFLGIYYRSPWFGALATYYIMLAGARALLLYGAHRLGGDRAKALRLYRLCGGVLLLLTVALGAICYNAIFLGESSSYPGHLIYGVAAFAFYNITLAIRNVLKYRKRDDLIVSAEKILTLASALVSMFSLQTSLISTFGDGDAVFAHTMGLATGGAFFGIILLLALRMIFRRR